MEKNAKIFVAGHRGLVGSAIVRKLRSLGYENLALAPRAELDLTRQEAVEAFFDRNRPEYVFVAAAKVGGIYANSHYPADFIRDNLFIQNNVIDASLRFGVKKLLFLGSSCIYPRACPQPMKEEHLMTGPLEPTNQWYAVAKIAGIYLCRAFREQHGFNAIAAMPTNLYGENDNFDLMTSHLPPALLRKFHLARLAAAGDEAGIRKDVAAFGSLPDDFRASLDRMARNPENASVPLWGDGTPLREFLHVDDTAGACVFLMEHYDGGEIVNVGSGEEMSVRDLALLARKVVGFSGGISFDPSKPSGMPRKLMDVSRIRAMGWAPEISMEEGLARTYRWYLDRTREARPA